MAAFVEMPRSIGCQALNRGSRVGATNLQKTASAAPGRLLSTADRRHLAGPRDRGRSQKRRWRQRASGNELRL